MAIDEDLVVCKQVDSDKEFMMLIEERTVLDDDEIKNEVTELEYENEEGLNDGTIEESLGHTYLILCCVGPNDPLSQVSTNNENHVHVLISDMASI